METLITISNWFFIGLSGAAMTYVIYRGIQAQDEKYKRKMKEFKEAEEEAKLPQKVEEYLNHINL